MIGVGDRVGEYEIETLLGAGGMGDVYRVRHAISRRLEALKAIRPDRIGSGEIEERFLREIRLLASVDHPNIARLHTAFRAKDQLYKDQLYMVMELVLGASLRDLIKKRAVSLEAGVTYTKQVLSALDYAHGLGIIHRDLKPANIMIEPDRHVKLLDFGLAYPIYQSEFTRPGTALGTVEYMAPEQIRGEPSDARSDLYSLGVTLYQTLTGQLPFSDASDYLVARKHLDETPADPRTIKPDIPEKLAQIVLKLLSKSPAARFQTAQEVLLAFDDAPDSSLGNVPEERLTQTITTNRLMLDERPSLRPTGFSPDAHTIGELRGALARFVGPIAGRIVSHAVGRARDLKHLHQLLASELETDKERSAFLTAISRNS